MKSGSQDRSGRGLAHRVVLVAIASALVGALVAAVVAIASVDSLLADKADERLMGAVATLADELDEDHRQRDLGWLEAELQDENGEMAPSGIELGVFSGKRKIAGLGPDRTPDIDDCETQGMLGVRIRSCSQTYGDWVLVASQRSDGPELRWLYLLAALGACSAGAVTGGILGFFAARSVVRPLVWITRRLRQLNPATGEGSALGAPTECAEVEAIRSALADLMDRIRGLLLQAERFAGDASHELKTPLAALCAELELTAETLDAPHREAVQRAHANAVRLSNLVERLLMLALPEGRIAQGFEPVSLEEVVSDVIAALDGEAAQRIDMEPASGEGLVSGDQALLRSMVGNAIENALEHGGQGRVAVTLAEPTDAEPWVRLEVRDEGTGIPREFRTQVFEPFFRLGGGASRGHGLGLALIAHVARAHGGHAEFLDAEAGAHLAVRLPPWSSGAKSTGSSRATHSSTTRGVPQ